MYLKNTPPLSSTSNNSQGNVLQVYFLSLPCQFKFEKRIWSSVMRLYNTSNTAMSSLNCHYLSNCDAHVLIWLYLLFYLFFKIRQSTYYISIKMSNLLISNFELWQTCLLFCVLIHGVYDRLLEHNFSGDQQLPHLVLRLILRLTTQQHHLCNMPIRRDPVQTWWTRRLLSNSHSSNCSGRK